MSLGGNWIAEVRTTVERAGVVRAMDKRYYCAELLSYIGWEVTVLLPVDEGAPAQVWRGQHYLCSPNLIQDVGFLDHEAALATVIEYRAKRAELRQLEEDQRASIIRGQAKALLNLIDDRIEHARASRNLLRIIKGEPLARAVKCLMRKAGMLAIDDFKGADDKRVERADASLQHAEAIFKHFHAVFGGHLHGVDAPAAVDGEEPILPRDGAHRLCGDAK